MSIYLTWFSQSQRFACFSQNILLAHKYHKHEEASENVEAVNNSEEDLKVAGVLTAGNVPVVAMEEVMETGEGPEDAEYGEQLAEENLERNNKEFTTIPFYKVHILRNLNF